MIKAETMFKKKTVRDVNVQNKRVLVRVDFNVPLTEGKVTDDTRIRAALPTLEYLLEQKAAVILFSHLGRPKSAADVEYSMRPTAEHLKTLIAAPVFFAEDCVGPICDELAPTIASEPPSPSSKEHAVSGGGGFVSPDSSPATQGQSQRNHDGTNPHLALNCRHLHDTLPSRYASRSTVLLRAINRQTSDRSGLTAPGPLLLPSDSRSPLHQPCSSL